MWVNIIGNTGASDWVRLLAIGKGLGYVNRGGENRVKFGEIEPNHVKLRAKKKFGKKKGWGRTSFRSAKGVKGPGLRRDDALRDPQKGGEL